MPHVAQLCGRRHVALRAFCGGPCRYPATRTLTSPRGWLYLPCQSTPTRHVASIAAISHGAARNSWQPALSRPYSLAHADHTIYALSSAPGRAAIAIVRISGPQCLDIYNSLCPGQKPLRSRRAAVRTLYMPGQRDSGPASVLDSSALVLYFDAPNTVTGQDVLELHIHGGTATTKAVLSAIPTCSPTTIRYAEPGEFTRRAFLSDKLDLTQVEALGDTLAATTERQRQISVRGTSTNALAQQYDAWARQLLMARGELEALIDFSEDQHFDESPSQLISSVATQVRHLQSRLRSNAANAMRGELLRDGISLSLLGAPNTGKSSLLNRIVGREAAIVSPEAGTTRDIIEVSLDLGGYLVRLGDTAGLRTSTPAPHVDAPIGMVEREGVRRAIEKARNSNLVLIMMSFEHASDSVRLCLDSEVVEVARELVKQGSNVLVIANKKDLSPSGMTTDVKAHIIRSIPGVDSTSIFGVTCSPTGPTDPDDDDGIQPLLSAMISRFADMTSPISDYAGAHSDIAQESLGATQRHRSLLEEALRHLTEFLESADASEVDVVLAAESLRSAAQALGRITGRGGGSDVEAVLGVVFEKFCVGK